MKPPLGIMSRDIWDAVRLENLAAAVERYRAAGLPIPVAWEIEQIEISRRLMKNEKRER